ncbi:MAG TPA: hypothetical protein ACHBX0_12755 [Arsenophonus sp.]
MLTLQAVLNEEFLSIRNHQQAVLLARLTTVADWVGSGSFFENPLDPWWPYIDSVLDNARCITPTLRNGLTFAISFRQSRHTLSTKPAQITLYQNCSGTGIYISKAPMGLGKTEAALYAVYQVLQRGEACGIYFGITHATGLQQNL